MFQESRYKCSAMVVLVLNRTLRCGINISSQMAQGKSDIFIFLSFGYTTSFLFASVLCCVKRMPIIPPCEYTWKIIKGCVLDVVANGGIYLASSFMPLGAKHALYMGLYILIPIVIDNIKGNVKVVSTITSLIVIWALCSSLHLGTKCMKMW